MPKTIQVTVTSTNYKKLGDYLKDYKSPAFPYSLRNQKEQTTNNNFDWKTYAREFISWGIPTISNDNNYVNGVKAESVYDVKGDDDSTNVIMNEKNNYRQIENAFRNYPDKLEEIRRVGYSPNGYLDLPIKPGIKFFIPLEKISREALLIQGVEVVSNNEPAFKAQALLELEMDRGYRKVFKANEQNVQFGDLKVQYPDITIWVWCRALSENTSLNEELTGQIFNITPFVQSLNTSHTKNGGNFAINLAPIIAERDILTGKWILKHNTVLQSQDKESMISTADSHTVANINGSNKLVRNQFLFHNIISSNDLVFIRYETLENEAKQRLRDNDSYVVDKINLPNRIYDMIGLVDRNGLSIRHEVNESDVVIHGRDLSKLFIDDGSYFYSMENKQGVMYLHGGATAKNQYSQRIISTNAYLYLGLYYNNSIEEILKFVIQQLTNITVVPDDLFSAYDGTSSNVTNTKMNSVPQDIKENVDRRNTRIKDSVYKKQFTKKDLETSAEENRQKLLEKEREVTNLIKNFRIIEFKEDVNLSVADINVTSPTIFKNLVRFIEYVLEGTTQNGEKIAKFSTFSGGTNKRLVGWREHIYNGSLIEEDIFPDEFVSNGLDNSYGLFFRFVDIPNIPFSYDTFNIVQEVYKYIQLKAALNKNDIANYPEELGNGIWQIVKLVIDKKVAKRMLIDSSISSANGSLINFLKKVAMEPFVELFMDTYKDQFYIIVRQPPTDKVGMESYLTGNYQDIQNINESENTLSNPAIVDIEEIDVASDTLSFDDNNIYSWYHFVPQASFIGNSTQFSTTLIPAIYFPEYAEIWGAKSLDFIHNYTNYYSQYQSDSPQQELSNIQLQAFYDMKYVIESNQYIPFTRKGSITIKGGDRRIKVGNPVRLLSTGEIFWVDGVNHNFMITGSEIERSTTIQVSRGLNEAFIYGVRGSVLNSIYKGSGHKFDDEKVFSYFNIINTELNFSQKKKVNVYEMREKKIDTSTKDKSKKDFTDIQNGYSDGNVISDLADVRDINNSNIFAPVSDKNIEEKILGLHPNAQPIFRRFINTLMKIGWTVIITSARRSYREQYKLWEAAGKKNVARAGTSSHETGFAIDINVIANKNINGIIKGTQLRLGGSNEASRSKEKLIWIRSGIPEIARSMGIMWGGNYTNYSDNVHFQVPNNVQATIVNPPVDETIEYERVVTGTTEVIDESSVFSNFKVDKEIFNFFLTKQQMGIIARGNAAKMLPKLKTTDDLVKNNIIKQEQLINLSRDAKNKLKNIFNKG